MDQKFKKKWVAALRSGKYAQGQKALCTPGKNFDRFCCLGVACDLLDDKAWREDSDGGIDFRSKKWGMDNTELPYGVLVHIELSYESEQKLIKMNDSDNRSFKYIANYIEKYL